ncbi:MAG: hypothetical protein R3F56_21685 [Planctomycetota bacterium]
MLHLRLLVVCSLLLTSLHAQVTTWTGAQSTDWNTAANWSAGVPIDATDVSVPARLSRMPSLSGTGACRNLNVASGATLTLVGRATLDVNANATARGTVTGSGFVRMRAPATLLGRFGNVLVDAPCRVVAGSILAGTLTASADSVVESGCTLGALVLDRGATVTTDHAALASVIVSGVLVVPAGTTLANAATVPLVLRGTSFDVAGRVTGELALEVSALTRFSLRGAVSGDVSVNTVAGQSLTIAGSGVGHIDGALTVTASSSARGDLFLTDVTTGDVSLTVTNATITGHVECGDFRLFNSRLVGTPTDELVVDTMALPGVSQVTDPPGRIVVRQGITINSSNNFAPVRGVIVFNDSGQNVTVGVSDNPLPRFSEIRVENGAQVLFRSGNANTSGKGPRIDNLTVTDGAADAVYCVLDQVTVESAGVLTVRTEAAANQCIVGPTTVRGLATFTDTDFGDSTLANSLTVDDGGDVLIGNGSLTVTGDVEVGSGRLRLGAGVGLLVATAGRLRLDGTPLAPAVVEGSNSAMQVLGRLEARSFRFSGMSSAGVRIASTAVLGPPPFDLRGGLFSGGSPGAVLLDLARPVPTTLFDLDFDDTAAAHNVRALTSSAAITIVDARGNLAGAAFEDDPAGRIAWRGNATQVFGPAAAPGVHRNTVTFTSTNEETTAFRLARVPGPPLAPVAATGPRSYVVVDDGLLAGTLYTYTLERQRLSPFAGEWQALGSASATPHAANEGITRFVGANGYADIASALAGASSGTIVFVESGTYGGFAVDRPARVIGSGLVTIEGAVSVANVTGAGDVVLDGLTLAPGHALTVVDTTVPVVLRAVTCPGDLRVERSRKVAAQRVVIGAGTALVAATVHVASSGLAAIDASQASRLVHAATTTGAITRDPTSVVIGQAGASAVLDMAPAWPAGTLQTLAVGQGGGGHLFTLLLGSAHDYLDLSAALPLDMVLLLAPTSLVALPGGVLGATGSFRLTLPVPAGPQNAGLALQLQLQTLDPVTLQGRFAEVRQVQFLR